MNHIIATWYNSRPIKTRIQKTRDVFSTGPVLTGLAGLGVSRRSFPAAAWVYFIARKSLVFEKILIKSPVLSCRESNPNFPLSDLQVLLYCTSKIPQAWAMTPRATRLRETDLLHSKIWKRRTCVIDSSTQPNRSQALTGKGVVHKRELKLQSHTMEHPMPERVRITPGSSNKYHPPALSTSVANIRRFSSTYLNTNGDLWHWHICSCHSPWFHAVIGPSSSESPESLTERNVANAGCSPGISASWKIDTQISRDETSSFQAWWMDQLGSTLKRRKLTRHGLPASRKPKTARSSYNISWEMRLTSTDKWQWKAICQTNPRNTGSNSNPLQYMSHPFALSCQSHFTNTTIACLFVSEKWYKNVVYRIEASTSNTHDTKGKWYLLAQTYPRHWKNGIFGGRVRETTGFVLHLNPLRKFVKQIVCQESCVMVNAFSFFRKGASCQRKPKQRASSRRFAFFGSTRIKSYSGQGFRTGQYQWCFVNVCIATNSI